MSNIKKMNRLAKELFGVGPIKGPKTQRGAMRKVMTGDGRKKLRMGKSKFDLF